MRPTARTVWLVAAGVPVALLTAVVDARLWPLWLVALFGVLAAAGIDALLGLPRRRLRIVVEAPDEMFIGDRGTAVLRFIGRGWRRPATLEAIVEVDPLLAPIARQTVTLARASGHAEAARPIDLEPRRRGAARILAVHARWSGPFGLVERRTVAPSSAVVRIVPNIGSVRAIALRMLGSPEFLAGLKVERYLGDGTEFESLREYLPGLDHRAIDWKQSARHRKLLTQEFRAERNHQVVIAIDGGQLMAEPLAGIPRLDHAINASLLLGWFCLRTGDRVGFASFDERLRSWAEPMGGAGAFPRLRHLTADVAYRAVDTNFTLAIAELSTRLRRRSLIVLFTEVLDTITAELMIENVTRLARRHLVMFVSLRDPGVEARMRALPSTITAMNEAVVAADFDRERAVVFERLRQVGVHCIDTTPDRFSMAVINRYLAVKRRELF
ncbi:MAG TPA: DUF58 domain-containing protein [Kofleriaceae bacterium]|nr:DUF58 domain-containing protein [Kofleriaceae bacterium]